MERKRPEPQPADDDRSGWAHYRRQADGTLALVERCPDPAGPHGPCGTAYRHGWCSSAASRRDILRRLGQDRWGWYDPSRDGGER
jgi:hypothetical protein